MDDPQDPFNKDINFFKSGLDQGKILGLTIRNFSLIDTKSGIASRDEWHTVVFVLPDYFFLIKIKKSYQMPIQPIVYKIHLETHKKQTNQLSNY